MYPSGRNLLLAFPSNNYNQTADMAPLYRISGSLIKVKALVTVKMLSRSKLVVALGLPVPSYFVFYWGTSNLNGCAHIGTINLIVYYRQTQQPAGMCGPHLPLHFPVLFSDLVSFTSFLSHFKTSRIFNYLSSS